MASETHKIHWRGIDIEISHTPQGFDDRIARLEVKSINPLCAPLPMTETGYSAHYHSVGMIERDYNGDVVKYVTEWLERKSKSGAWRNYVMASRQGELF